MIKNVTVYCSSSAAVSAVYHRAATDLGTAIARRGWALVYGGERIGLMGDVATAARAAGAAVIGISPKQFADYGRSDPDCTEFIVACDMRHRKLMLEDRGDAFIALPGGIGTFEEFFEILAGKHLAFHSKPIVLLDIEGFYRPLLALIDHGIEHKFIKPSLRKLFFVANTVDKAMDFLTHYQPPKLSRPKHDITE
jgi:uncharacterized protein (TIGR00730 family)